MYKQEREYTVVHTVLEEGSDGVLRVKELQHQEYK
jgi:hypothetical protein